MPLFRIIERAVEHTLKRGWLCMPTGSSRPSLEVSALGSTAPLSEPRSAHASAIRANEAAKPLVEHKKQWYYPIQPKDQMCRLTPLRLPATYAHFENIKLSLLLSRTNGSSRTVDHSGGRKQHWKIIVIGDISTNLVHCNNDWKYFIQ